MQETDFFVAVLEGDLALLHSKEEDGLDSLEEDADFIKWIILFMFPEGLRALFCFLFIILVFKKAVLPHSHVALLIHQEKIT